jgi:hypothetical protein
VWYYLLFQIYCGFLLASWWVVLLIPMKALMTFHCYRMYMVAVDHLTAARTCKVFAEHANECPMIMVVVGGNNTAQ